MALCLCKATASAMWPATTDCGHLSLRGSADGGCSNGNKPLVKPTVVMFTLLISQEAPRDCCLDCHHSISLSFHTVINSHMLSFPSLSVFVSVEAHTHLMFLSLPLCILLIYSSRGWVVCAPGQLIQFPLCSCEPAAIPK